MIIYVAGPYRAETENEVRENIIKAREAAVEILKRGHIPVSPHLLWEGMGGIVDDTVFLDAGLDILERFCDAIYMVNGWHDSQGSINEHENAQLWGKRVFYNIKAIPDGK